MKVNMPEYVTGVQQVLPEGDYEFVVDDAGEKASSKGNPMIELQLIVEHDGAEVRVFDNLVFVEAAFWKIDAFRVSTGEKLVEGQKVNFEAEDCIGRRGRCHLFTDTYEGRTRNRVDSYLPPEEGTKNVPAKPGASGGSESSSGEPDDINF
jgi:uncharacterized protein DUF669